MKTLDHFFTDKRPSPSYNPMEEKKAGTEKQTPQTTQKTIYPLRPEEDNSVLPSYAPKHLKEEKEKNDRGNLYMKYAPQERTPWTPIPQHGNYEKKKMSLSDIYHALNPLPTEEEERIINKRNKARQIAAAVGDGISAIANLVGTTQYSKPFQPSNLSAAYAARLEQLRAERKAQASRYNQMLLAMKENEREQEAQAAKQQVETDRWNKKYSLDLAKYKHDVESDNKTLGLKIQGQIFDQNHKTKQLGAQIRHDKATEAIGWSNVNIAQQRERRLAEKDSGNNVHFINSQSGKKYHIDVKNWENVSALRTAFNTMYNKGYFKGKYFGEKARKIKLGETVPGANGSSFSLFAGEKGVRKDQLQELFQQYIQQANDSYVVQAIVDELNSYRTNY